MALILIKVDRKKLPAHTEKEFEAWVKYHIHQDSLSLENPLEDKDMDGILREISYRS